MAVLVFITVLIVLLLILTVMVHMRNRKLKSTLEEQMAERRLLDKICADFTAVYYVELNTNNYATTSIVFSKLLLSIGAEIDLSLIHI